jgi:hypothetical protein
MDDIEVIELGEDGSFEIPVSNVNRHVNKYLDEMKPEDDMSIYPDVKYLNELSLKEIVKAGEYKIYKNDNKLFIIVRLQSNENLKDVKLNNFIFTLSTDLSKTYKITVPTEVKINPSSAICKVWQDFVSTTFDLV